MEGEGGIGALAAVPLFVVPMLVVEEETGEVVLVTGSVEDIVVVDVVVEDVSVDDVEVVEEEEEFFAP